MHTGPGLESREKWNDFDMYLEGVVLRDENESKTGTEAHTERIANN
jgi:hypothetical protein